MDDLTVHQIHTGNGDGAEIVFDFNDQRLSVSIFPDETETVSVVGRVIHLLERSTSADIDDDQYEEIVDEALKIILDAGRALFLEASKTNTGNHQKRSLHEALYPSMIDFQLVGDGQGTPAIVPISSKEAYAILSEDAVRNDSCLCASSWGTNLPCYSTKEITVEETLVGGAGHFTGRVSVRGGQMFCKAEGSGALIPELGVGRELECLQQLLKDDQSARKGKLRIPQLSGLVVHAKTGGLVGFVRQWIPGRFLRDDSLQSASSQRKAAWVEQIRETIQQLHAIDLVWGDGKAANVIIDESDGAWLIDFGGGYTKGWVDEGLSNTIDGDKQAIRRIQAFLGLNETI